MKKGHCEVCGCKIPNERLEVLPDTKTCVKCSQTQPYSESEALGVNLFEEQERSTIEMEDIEFDYPEES